MIKIKKEDSITDVLKKISNEKKDKILLDFPFWHPILHNYISLKIIKTKARKKDITIVSNDKTAKKIGKLLWIKFIKNKNNDFETINKQKFLKDNYTFFEYAQFEIKSFFSKFKWNIKNNKKINNIYYLKNKYSTDNKKIIPYFILILIIIFFVFLYIFYFAINKTQIIIYPEIDVRVKSRNFNFIEEDKNNQNYILNNQIKLNRITKKITLKNKIITSWIKQDKKNKASWKVIFTNLLNEKVYLLKNTTLQTKDWIQFYLENDLTIPANWKKETILYWKIKLLNWEYSWIKSNISTWTLLAIPKLSKENRSKIFAKSITKFNWWSNNFINFLKKEDIENAKKIMLENLKIEWIKQIKEEINKINKNNSIKIEILPVDNIFKFKDINIKIPEHLKLWDEIKSFTIQWELTIYSFTYNKEVVISLLKNLITENTITDLQKIISIDNKSLRISHILKRNDLEKINWKYKYSKNFNKKLRIKSTIEIEYNTSNKFNNKNNFFNTKIKNLILWKNIKKAEKILLNRTEINNVKIKIQPFFLKTISKIPENIEIIVEE